MTCLILISPSLTFVTRVTASLLHKFHRLPWLFAAFIIAPRLLPLRHPLLAASTASVIFRSYCWVAANVSESTIKKCFTDKVGFLSEDESLVSFTEAEHQEFDPFPKLVDSDLVQVNSLFIHYSDREPVQVRSSPKTPVCPEFSSPTSNRLM